MNESDFWLDLEFRVCCEFSGMSDARLRDLWCDGFITEELLLDCESPRIVGSAWIGNRWDQKQWEFTLFLNHPAATLSEIERSALLPPEGVTRWLAVDPVRKRLQIEPAAAVADAL